MTGVVEPYLSSFQGFEIRLIILSGRSSLIGLCNAWFAHYRDNMTGSVGYQAVMLVRWSASEETLKNRTTYYHKSVPVLILSYVARS